eukprot:gnl/TRDRNA2_/TRDRNA2_75118_c0_seq2.p1 gnl/TRDRNA2_/TRDRNA2_75118_c0~~gnl/TRDRNA2_/TRDRNA2_75118_c0_seq2.p1  ORF type:complete len:282 (-),score=38.49 gnl/TRDRNA2_/TRDRNA2_75118_c0_seq2:240-1085(-)
MSQVYVITGSTKGIGYGLARELIARGQKVVVNGRTSKAVDAAVEALTRQQKHQVEALVADHVAGFPADIALKQQVQALFDFAMTTFGRVDCWINNAAISPDTELDLISDTVVHEALATNVAGTLLGCQVAAKGMKAQSPPGGRIYFVEGLGTDGRQMGSMSAVYGSTKYANAYLAEAIKMDLKAEGKIQIGCIQPGMVMTDLLLNRYRRDPSCRAEVKKICNILAEPEAVVTPWLADGLVAGKLTLRWLTGMGIMWRFLSAPCSSRDLFEKVDKEIAEAGA